MISVQPAPAVFLSIALNVVHPKLCDLYTILSSNLSFVREASMMHIYIHISVQYAPAVFLSIALNVFQLPSHSALTLMPLTNAFEQQMCQYFTILLC